MKKYKYLLKLVRVLGIIAVYFLVTLSVTAAVENNFDDDFGKAVTSQQSELLLKKYPDKGKEIVPKLESKISSEISNKGFGNRFVIKEIMPQSGSTVSMTIGQQGEDLIFLSEFSSDVIPMVNNLSSLFGDYCIHRFAGRVQLNVGDGIYTFISEENKINRLTFVLMPAIGYVYLRGKGKIILKDGKEINLGY